MDFPKGYYYKTNEWIALHILYNSWPNLEAKGQISIPGGEKQTHYAFNGEKNDRTGGIYYN